MKAQSILWTILLPLIVIASVFVVSACGGGGGGGSSSSSDDTASTDTGMETVNETGSETSSTIPSNSLALFATVSLGTETQSFPAAGEIITWDSTQYQVIRYIPSEQFLDEFGSTSSQSFAKSYIYGITAGEWYYKIRVSTDTGRRDITRMDPKTGESTATFSTFYTNDTYRGFAIVGDNVYYREKINEDLFGNYSSGGELMMLKIGETTPTELLDYNDDDNSGTFYGVGENLVAIVSNFSGGEINYEIRKLNTQTGKVEQSLISVNSENIISFYEGNTALFWSEESAGSSVVSIMKYSLSGSSEVLFNIPISSPSFIEIDESQSKVLIVFRAGTPYVPYYYLYDTESNNLEQLDIDSVLYSTSIYGNGQFYIIE